MRPGSVTAARTVSELVAARELEIIQDAPDGAQLWQCGHPKFAGNIMRVGSAGVRCRICRRRITNAHYERKFRESKEKPAMNAQTFAPKLRQHFTGFILSRLALMVRGIPDEFDGGDAITIDQRQSNGAYGIHQARVRLSGDPTVYRLLLMPADAPVSVRGCPISEHFALPIGDA